MWANQYRILGQQTKNLARVIGNLLLPIAKVVLPVLNGIVMALQEIFTWLGFSIFGKNWLSDLNDGVSAGAMATDDLVDSLGNADDAIDSVSASAKKLKKTLLGFDEINALSDKNSGSSSGSGDSFDLSGAIGDLVSDYESLWEKALNDANNPAIKIRDWILKQFKQDDWEKTGEEIAGMITKGLKKIPWDKIQDAGIGFFTRFAQLLNGLADPEMFAEVGVTVAEALNTAIYSKLAFLNTFKFDKAGEAVASAINGFLETYDFKAKAETLNKWVDGLREFFVSAIKGIDEKDLAKAVTDFLGEIELDTLLFIIGAFAFKKLTKKKLFEGFIKTLPELFHMTGSQLGMTIAVALAVTFVGAELAKDAKKWIDNIKEYGWDEGRKKTAEDKGRANPYSELRQKDYKMIPVNPFGGKTLFEVLFGFDLNDKLIEEFDKLKENGRKGLSDFKESFHKFLDGGQLKTDIENGWANVKTFFKVDMPTSLRTLWDEDIKPAFDGFDWSLMTASIGDAFKSDKWEEFKTTAKENFSTFIDVNVAPFFTKEKWSEIGTHLQAGFDEKWNAFKTDFEKSKVGEWWNTFKANFTKDKFLENIGSIKDAMQERWNDFKAWWDNLKLKFPHIDMPHFTYSTQPTTLFGKTIDMPSIDVQWYANGGFPDSASLFWANENGIPEMVGTMGGRTAVANNAEITEGIRSAVVDGMMEVMMNNSNNENAVPVIENVFKVDSETLYRATKKGEQKYNSRYHIVSEF